MPQTPNSILLFSANDTDVQIIREALPQASIKQWNDFNLLNLKEVRAIDPDIIIISCDDDSLPQIDNCEGVQEVTEHYPITAIVPAAFAHQRIETELQGIWAREPLTANEISNLCALIIEKHSAIEQAELYGKELEATQARLLMAQKIAKLGYWEMGLNLDYMLWSDEVFTMFRMEKKETEPSFDLLLEQTHPADREIVKKTFEYAVETREDFNFDHRILLEDGNVRYLNTQIQTTTDSATGDDLLIGTFQDISSRKEIEKMLLASEDRYRSLFQVSRDGIYMSTVTGDLIDFNKAAEDIFGYSREELINLNVSNLWANPEDRIRFRDAIRAQGHVEDYEIKIKKKNGQVIDCIITSNEWKDNQGKFIGYQGIIRDITERKRGMELRKAKDLAERSARLKEEFLANMSHEIRTPLNAIYGITNLMQDTPLNPQQKTYMTTMQSSARHLLDIINDILDFSKIEAGQMTFSRDEIELRELISGLTASLEVRAKDKGLQLLTDIEEEVPQVLTGDRMKLRQILFNLLGNAVKFTEKGHVKLEVRLLSKDSSKAKLHFLVIDTGIGIPPAKMSAIFDSFTQVDELNTKKYQGTGLGLAITKKLIDLQGGEIKASSTLNQGSTFDFTLEFEYAVNTRQPLKQRAVDQNADLSDKHILLVEDNPVNRMVALEMLKKRLANGRVDTAENGLEAVEQVRANHYDLILMDVQMPEMDGLEATQSIRANSDKAKAEIPILALTAYSSPADIDKCFKAGMNDYISKPFDPPALFSKIAQLTQAKVGEATINTEERPAQEKAAIPSFGDGPLVNPSYLDNATDNDQDLRDSMIDMIVAQTPGELKALEEMILAKDWDKTRARAHKLKSSLAFFGNNELNKLIKDIERDSREQILLDDIYDKFNVVKEITLQCLEEVKAIKGTSTQTT